MKQVSDEENDVVVQEIQGFSWEFITENLEKHFRRSKEKTVQNNEYCIEIISN